MMVQLIQCGWKMESEGGNSERKLEDVSGTQGMMDLVRHIKKL